MTLFTLDMTIDGVEHPPIAYATLDECFTDAGLQALFDDSLVSRCAINIGAKRIAALPTMSWGRLREQLISNSTTILRGMYG